MPTRGDLLIAAESLKAMLVACATGERSNTDSEYRVQRDILTTNPGTKTKLPRFVQSCRTVGEFWGFIQPKFRSYHERRQYLQAEFDPLLTMLESGSLSPGDEAATAILTRLDWTEVQTAWQKALARKTDDPEGAITAARTLLETVCKHVLDDASVPYDSGADLPKVPSVPT